MNRWLEIDSEVFRARFNTAPFYVRHRLGDHPLFTIDRLVQLARTLPKSFCEWWDGGSGINYDGTHTPMEGLSAEETARRIEENKSYLVLKWVDADPEYRQLLDECMDQIAEHSEAICPGMHKRAGFIFLTAPRETVPFHMDHEHNFLLQIRGQKTVHQWDPNDRFVLTDREIEEHYAGGKHRYMEYRADFAPTAFTLPIRPGDGIHFPVCAPHTIQNDDNLSISFSITFRSRWTRRRELLYHANARLRRMGLEPSPVGESRVEDLVKHSAMRVASAVRRLAGSHRTGGSD